MGRGNTHKSKLTLNHPVIKDINQYLELYGIHKDGTRHEYEFLQYGKEKIFIQSFAPSKPIGVVLVVHGYFDHSGSMRNLINDLLHKSYQVVTYDLQGHGLSSGPRAEINDFNDYVKVFHEVNNWASRKTTLPVHVVAHSTGGAIVMDYLVRRQANFQNVILVSPLIRSHQWRLSKLGIMLIKPFVKELTRVFKRNSSNSTYLKFVKQDPLQHQKVPLVWFEALLAWNKKITDYQKCYEEVLVIQGDRDRTVDWKYNLTFIQKQFPNCQIRLIHGGDHQLLNENPRLLEETLVHIREGLKE